jgi:large subunit ribosomal protein L21
MDYAIIKVGNKQHRVRDGETLVVDRVRADAGASFEPVVLLGEPKVSATVVAHERGPKIIIGKYRKRTGYKRHNGFRAATSRITISLGGEHRKAAPAKEAKPKTPAKVEAESAESPVASAPAAAEAGGALPEGYAQMTVADISAGAKEWSRDALDAALVYERDHAARKGALAALEAALAKEDA